MTCSADIQGRLTRVAANFAGTAAIPVSPLEKMAIYD